MVPIGDTVIADRFPLDHAASAFGTFGQTSETVTSLASVAPNTGVAVNVSSGFIGWVRQGDGEGVLFGFGGGGLNPVILDVYDPSVDCDLQTPDLIFVDPHGTLDPDQGAGDITCDQSDNAFVDVSLNLP